LEVLAQAARAPIVELARELGCSKLEAFSEKRKAAEALAPYLHPKLSSVAIYPPGHPLSGVPSTLISPPPAPAMTGPPSSITRAPVDWRRHRILDAWGWSAEPRRTLAVLDRLERTGAISRVEHKCGLDLPDVDHPRSSQEGRHSPRGSGRRGRRPCQGPGQAGRGRLSGALGQALWRAVGQDHARLIRPPRRHREPRSGGVFCARTGNGENRLLGASAATVSRGGTERDARPAPSQGLPEPGWNTSYPAPAARTSVQKTLTSGKVSSRSASGGPNSCNVDGVFLGAGGERIMLDRDQIERRRLCRLCRSAERTVPAPRRPAPARPASGFSRRPRWAGSVCSHCRMRGSDWSDHSPVRLCWPAAMTRAFCRAHQSA